MPTNRLILRHSSRFATVWLAILGLYLAARFGSYVSSWQHPLVGVMAIVSPFAACGAMVALAVKGDREKGRRLWAGCLGVAAILVLELAHRTLFLGLPPGAVLDRFEPDKWKSPSSTDARASSLTSRQRMLGDVAKYVLPGRGRAELERSLGVSLPARHLAQDAPDLVYRLGPARGISLDSEWLLIWLDRGGHFARMKIAED